MGYVDEVFKQPITNIKLTPITTKEINYIIESLQWKNSQEHNEITLKILKINMPFIVSSLALTYMFNKVLSSGIFLMHLTYSQISPIFMKGCMTEMSNYRPISLLTSFSKVLERYFAIDFSSIYIAIIFLHRNSSVSEPVSQLS
jgi:dynactin complex subunit